MPCTLHSATIGSSIRRPRERISCMWPANLGERPRLPRVDVRAGHGAGKPLDKKLDEAADIWAFAVHWTGLAVGGEVVATLLVQTVEP